MIIDKMGPTAKIENRKILKELEEKFEGDLASKKK